MDITINTLHQMHVLNRITDAANSVDHYAGRMEASLALVRSRLTGYRTVPFSDANTLNHLNVSAMALGAAKGEVALAFSHLKGNEVINVIEVAVRRGVHKPNSRRWGMGEIVASMEVTGEG